MKIIHFDGRIGKDGAELKQSSVSGNQYLRFSVANNSYSNNQQKTEWFDVKVFDPHLIENKIKVLKKGTYVIIVGYLQTEVNVDRNNKVWVNQYVTALNIECPIFDNKSKEDVVDMSSGMSVTTRNISGTNQQQQIVSEQMTVGTANFSQPTVQQPVQQQVPQPVQPQQHPQPQMQPQPAYSQSAGMSTGVPSYGIDTDELPF